MDRTELPHFFDYADQPIFVVDQAINLIYNNDSFVDFFNNYLAKDLAKLVNTNAGLREFISEISCTTKNSDEYKSRPIIFGQLPLNIRCRPIDLEQQPCFILYIVDYSSKHFGGFSDVKGLLDMTSDGLFEYQIKSGELKVADNFYKVLGYNPGEFTFSYNRLIAMIHPHDVPDFLEKFESVMIGHERSVICEFRVLFKGGIYRWVKSNLVTRSCKKNLKPSHVMGNVIDIHEERQIFEATKIIFKDMAKIRGQAFFKSMAYNISQIIGVKYCVIAAPKSDDFCDMKALAFWENGQYLKDIEYPLAGTPCQHVINDKAYKLYSNKVDELFPEDAYLADNGIISYWGVPFFNSQDEPIGHVFIMDDKPIIEENWIDSVLRLFAASIGTELERNITRLALKEQKIKAQIQVRQRTRSLEKALVQLDTLFYRSSHDMRAPIASLEGLIHILKLEWPQINATSLITLLEGNIINMKKLNASIGQIGNIRNHEVEGQYINVYQIIVQTIDLVRQNQRRKDQVVLVDAHENLSFYTDETLFSEVMENVLENAFRFSKVLNTEQPEQIHVRASIRNNRLMVKVTDNGIGFSDDQRTRIFEMFFRGAENRDGFGLGLYKTEIALSKIKGTINMESNTGQGTEVSIQMLSLEIKKEVEQGF